MIKKKSIMLAAVVIAFLLLLGGCGTSLNVSFNYDGSGEAIFVIPKEAAGFTQAKAKIEEQVNYYNQSEGVHRLRIKSIEEKETGTVAVIAFKNISWMYRINKFTGSLNTEFEFKNFEKYYSFNSNDILMLKDVSSGKVSEAQQLNAKKNYKVFYLKNLDITGISEVTLRFPGKVKFISSGGITVIDEHSVKLLPETVNIAITDDDGNVVNMDRSIIKKAYVLFDESPNTWIYYVIGGLVLITAVLIAVSKKYKWFKKLKSSGIVKYLRQNYELYIFMIPGVVLLLAFCYAPMYGLVLAFQNYRPQDGILGSEFIGLKNFIDFFSYINMERMFVNTIVLALFRFLTSFPMTIIFALLINEISNKMFKRTIQTISYLPYFISWVVISGMSYSFFASNGLLNKLLAVFGQDSVNWYTDSGKWWGILTITSLWKSIGWGTIVYLASISAINSELYEAANIDGAGRLKQVLHVTIPGMMPIIGITLIFAMGGLIRDDFEQIYALVGNNQILAEKTEVIGTFIFARTIGGSAGYGPATAVGLFQSVISMLMILLCNYAVKKSDNPGLW